MAKDDVWGHMFQGRKFTTTFKMREMLKQALENYKMCMALQTKTGGEFTTAIALTRRGLIKTDVHYGLWRLTDFGKEFCFHASAREWLCGC